MLHSDNLISLSYSIPAVQIYSDIQLIISGTTYHFILNTFDMTDDTRAMLKRHLDSLYEPTAWATNIMGTIRNVIFVLGNRILLPGIIR